MTIQVFCDGSAGEKGIVAWAYKIIDDTGREIGEDAVAFRSSDISEQQRQGNSNVAEVFAVFSALCAIKDLSVDKYITSVELYSDSTYAISVVKGQIPGFDKSLSREIRRMAKNFRVKVIWVKGHSGNAFHDDCDRRASQVRKQLLRSIIAAEKSKAAKRKLQSSA